MARRKAEWAVCRISGRDLDSVIETFTDREDAVKFLKAEREKIVDKYNVVMLPLDHKGNPLLPP